MQELRAVLIGPVRQHLGAFDDLEIGGADYEESARMFNTFRRKGVQGAIVDFRICAVAIRHSAPVFTTEKDFSNYAKYLDLELHRPRKG